MALFARSLREDAVPKQKTMRKHSMLTNLRKDKELVFLALPIFIKTLIFSYLPMFGIIIAFKKINYREGILGSPWVGWKNFEFLFKSMDAWKMTRNTLLYNVAFIVLGTTACLILAFLLYEITSRPCLKTYQTILIVPNFISWVVVSYLAVIFLSQEYGLLNSLLQMFGIEPISWYSAAEKWPAIIIIANLWKYTGYSCLIYYASLMGIDKEYFEAATIDGATKMQCIRYISLPFLKPTIIILTIMSIGKIFNANFDLFYLLPNASTNGVLYVTTVVIDTYVFRALRGTGDLGMSAAAGLYQSVVGFILVLAANLTVRKIDPDSSLF